MAKVIPAWAERLIVAAIENYVDAKVIAETMAGWRDQFLAKLAELAKSTDNKLDDAAVALLTEVLTTCTPDKQFICDLIVKGEVNVVGMLQSLAASTETKIDDALVAVVVEALFPKK